MCISGGDPCDASTSYAALVDNLGLIEKHAKKNISDSHIPNLFVRCAGSILKILSLSIRKNRSDKTSKL